MSFFKKEQMPSIKGEMDKLDEQASQREAAEKARKIKEYENSPQGMARRRIENAAKNVEVTEYTPEALAEAEAELAEANAGLDKMLGNKTGHYGTDLANSEHWHTKINIAEEKVRQLKALRDLDSARGEVNKSA